jgi:hypothetical protein
MKHWLRFLVCAVEGLIVLGVTYFEPTCCVRGTLWGEAFFEGKPTTYWRGELDHWEVYSHQLFMYSLVDHPLRQPVRQPVRYVIFARQKSLLEMQREKWFPADPSRRSGSLIGPSIINEGEEAKGVLQSLVDDPSPRVRLMAQIGLGMNPKIPGDE